MSIKTTLYVHRRGIMGTIIIHLVFFISVFSIELKKIIIHEEISIELLSETIEKIEEKQEIEKKIKEIRQKTSDNEVEKMLRSIAVNEDITSKESTENIQIEDYIDQVTEELSNTDYGDRYKHKQNKNFIQDSLQNIKDNTLQKLDSLKSTFYSGKSSVSYILKGRHALYLPIPVFKCPTGGKIIIDIFVANNGKVQKAKLNAETPSSDECLTEVALTAAKRSRFNPRNGAETLQEGKITYHFVKQ